MRKLFLLLAIVLISAPASLAQDYSNWEFFIGYAHERANNGADRLDAQGRRVTATGATVPVDFPSKRVQYNGVTGEVVANVHRNVGLVGNVSATFHNATFRDSLSGQNFDAKLAALHDAVWPTLQLPQQLAGDSFCACAIRSDALHRRLRERQFHLSRHNRNSLCDGIGSGL